MSASGITSTSDQVVVAKQLSLSRSPDAHHEWEKLRLGVLAICVVLLLIFLSFLRALVLVNPAHQLANIVSSVQQSFKKWEKGFRLYQPLLGTGMQAGPLDTERLAFFSLHRHWTADAMRGVRHTAAYVRHYANAGDFEVSEVAVNSLVKINQLYVQTKGRTFFGNDVFFDTELSTDGVVNATLEQLRQLAEHGVQTTNETLAEQAMSGMAALVRVYATIDYGSPFSLKTHAGLASGYLDGAVQSAAPKNLADVVMHGVRLLGASGQVFIATKSGAEVATIAGNLCKFGLKGAGNTNYRPVTQEAMTQLADLTVFLLKSKSAEVGFAGKALLDAAQTISLIFMKVPDGQPMSIHSTYLGPFLSSRLPTKLTHLANAVVAADAADADAQLTIGNVEEWAANLSLFYKDLLVEAITDRSMVALDIGHSMAQMVRVLIGFAEAPATTENDRDKLVESAARLIYAFSWVPDSVEAIRFAKTCAVPKVFTDLAVEVAAIHHDEVRKAFLETSIGLLVKAAKNDARLRSAEKCIAAIAALLALQDQAHVPADVASLLQRRIGAAGGPSYEQIETVCRRATEEYIGRNPDHFTIDRLEVVINRLDRIRFETLLRELLATLVPLAPAAAP